MRNHEPYNNIEVKSKPKSKKWIKAAAAAALIADAPITVSGVECIAKSWPGFLDAYRQLGGIAK